MDDTTDRQRMLVIWDYGIQLVTLLVTFVLPLVLVVPVIYLVVIRNRVSIEWLRSHINWQLITSTAPVLVIPVALGLFVVAASQINQDSSLVSSTAGLMLVVLWFGFPLWLVYRIMRGLYAYSKSSPMKALLP